MVKRIFGIALAAFLFVGSAFAQNKIYITYSPEDCIGCNMHLEYVKRLQQPVEKTLIFPEDIIEDSAAVIKKYGLDEFDFQFVF